MNILEVIKQLQKLADEDPKLEVWSQDGLDPSDLCAVQEIRIIKPTYRFGNVVEIVS